MGFPHLILSIPFTNIFFNIFFNYSLHCGLRGDIPPPSLSFKCLIFIKMVVLCALWSSSSFSTRWNMIRFVWLDVDEV